MKAGTLFTFVFFKLHTGCYSTVEVGMVGNKKKIRETDKNHMNTGITMRFCLFDLKTEKE